MCGRTSSGGCPRVMSCCWVASCHLPATRDVSCCMLSVSSLRPDASGRLSCSLALRVASGHRRASARRVLSFLLVPCFLSCHLSSCHVMSCIVPRLLVSCRLPSCTSRLVACRVRGRLRDYSHYYLVTCCHVVETPGTSWAVA